MKHGRAVATVVVIVGLVILSAELAVIYKEITEATRPADEPSYGGPVYGVEVPYEHFKEVRERTHIRGCEAFGQNPTRFLEPDCPYVQALASMADTSQRPYDVALSVLNMIRVGVTYTRDTVQYGLDDYVAYPCETIYSGRGDCEDTSILYCSVMMALGYEPVLVKVPGHVLVGVSWDELEHLQDIRVEKERAVTRNYITYALCETTPDEADTSLSMWVSRYMFDIYPRSEPTLSSRLAESLAHLLSR